MGFFRRHRILSAMLLVFLVLVIGIAVLAVRFVASFSPVPLVISKETTYITEPLRSDGTPDYLAALNQRLSKGVTPENNAAVFFWRAMGPGMIQADRRAENFRTLGIPQPPDKGEYFVTPEAWIKRHEAKRDPAAFQPSTKDDDQVSKLLEPISRPWSKKEFSSLADWLAANEKPLAIIVEGCKRPRRYDPLIVSDKDSTLIGVLLFDAQQCREFSRCLVLRAMLRVKQGEVDEAWNDLMACHRLARLVGQGHCFVEAMVAVTIDERHRWVIGHFCNMPKFAPSQICKMRQDLAELPPMPQNGRFDEQG